MNSIVKAIAFSPGGVLVIGGNFTDAGGSATADYIAAWNGSGWSAVGGGLSGSVSTLLFADNGDLYVGGYFTDAGGDPDADGIAVWSSPTWSSVGGAGSGLSAGVSAIVFDGSGRLFVGGPFLDAGGDADADRVARWTPSGWASLGGVGSGIGKTVAALAADDTDALVAAGAFRNAGDDPDANYLARWDGKRWEALSDTALPPGSGLSDLVKALALDPQGKLYAGGSFKRAGGDPAGDHIAVWDGSGWSALGGPTSAISGDVLAIAFDDAGNVIAGGGFTDAGGDPDADYIALFDGADWGSLGGAGSGLGGDVYALVVGEDGKLYTGGDFEDAGGDTDADYVAVWDGVGWSALGGPGSGLDSKVLDVVFDDAGNLYAGGDFADAGGDPDADYVAVWNGATWASVGGTGNAPSYLINALALDAEGRLYIGGEFTSVGGIPGTERVAMWDGVSWNALGAGLNATVHDLVLDGAGNLYAAGTFEPNLSDPLHPREIAVWDGVSWSDLGSGLENDAWALAYDGGFNVFVGGRFFLAGDKASSRIGCYKGATPAGLLFFDGFESGDTNAWSSVMP